MSSNWPLPLPGDVSSEGRKHPRVVTRRRCRPAGWKDYGILQYNDVVGFTEVLVEEDDAEYYSGGIIGDGERAFIIMKTGDHLALGGDENDLIECYFYLTTSHDMSKGLSVTFAPVVKNSGVVLRFHGKPLTFRHGRHIGDRVKAAEKSIARIRSDWSRLPQSFDKLCALHINASNVQDYLHMVVPDPVSSSQTGITRAENVRAEIETIYRKSPTCQWPSTKGTMLGLYFATVEYLDVKKTVRANKYLKDNDQIRIMSCLEGASARQKADAYGFALELEKKFAGVSLSGKT